MAPATGTALLLLAAFVLPGFITLVARESTYVVRDAVTPFERLLLSLTYSVRVYGIIAVGAYLAGLHADDVARFYHGGESLGNYILLAALALLVLPVLLSETGRLWRGSRRLRPTTLKALRISAAHSTRSGWDHFFGSNTAALVRLTLDDGRVVAGYFGEKSLAAYSDDTQDLFLEERWELDGDGWFTRPATSSLGVWVPHSHIVSLEVYSASPPETREESRPASGRLMNLVIAGVLLIGSRRRRNAGRQTTQPDAPPS
jgi:Family of unknown function (DUF6338)